MTGLQISPSTTSLPGTTRRRIWSTPEILSHSLITLTVSRLYFASGKTPPGMLEAIQNGADLDDTFGPLATVIDLATITRIRLELVSNTLTIEYRVRGRMPARATIECQSHETADEIFSKIWRRLGSEFEVKGNQKPFLQIARKPLFTMFGVIILTALLALGSNLATDNLARDYPLISSLAVLDWKVFTALGGAVLALLQVDLYRKATQPPTVLELKPSTATP